MAKLNLDIVTAERVVFSQEVDSVVAPGVEGELGILPRHAPLLTALKLGELRIKTGGEEIQMAIGGGFLEVMPDKVVVLADSAERADEIDVARAQEAKRRAEQRLQEKTTDIDLARAESAMARALLRLKVAERRRRGRSPQ
ncbi:MAG: F0F1 ATP synthase subunit epsilon [Chloroflexota bacterium]|nr:MAG: F0F1 ATP synthase subunit epsilon [Chloroflexota bacterium]